MPFSRAVPRNFFTGSDRQAYWNLQKIEDNLCYDSEPDPTRSVNFMSSGMMAPTEVMNPLNLCDRSSWVANINIPATGIRTRIGIRIDSHMPVTAYLFLSCEISGVPFLLSRKFRKLRLNSLKTLFS